MFPGLSSNIFPAHKAVKTRQSSDEILFKYFYFLFRLKERYIIINTDGPDDNVLKLKPPMCFGQADAEFLLSNLNEVLSEVEATMKR